MFRCFSGDNLDEQMEVDSRTQRHKKQGETLRSFLNTQAPHFLLNACSCTHTQRGFGALLSGTWSALCQLCLQWDRRGAPCTSEREERPTETGKRRGAVWRGQGPEWREKAGHKTAFLQRASEGGGGAGGGCWNNAPSAAGAMAKAVCLCVCREHFLFCVNWADLLSFLCCKFNSQLINMWPFGAPVCAQRGRLRVHVCVCRIEMSSVATASRIMIQAQGV